MAEKKANGFPIVKMAHTLDGSEMEGTTCKDQRGL